MRLGLTRAYEGGGLFESGGFLIIFSSRLGLVRGAISRIYDARLNLLFNFIGSVQS